MNSYLLSLGMTFAIFAVLSVSLSLLIGHLGIFSMAHAALFGIGAYTSAFLTVIQGWAFVPAAALAVVVSGVGGLIMAVPTLRVSGDYFIVASFALQVVGSSVFANWSAVTGGTGGIPGILRPTIAGLDLFDDTAFLIYALVIAAFVAGVSAWLVRSPFGRMLHTIRDDEVVAVTMGKSVRRTKVTVTVVAAAFAGLAGVVYGQYLMYISPGSFDVSQSVSIITMVVVGGMTSIGGSVLGAAIIVAIPQLLDQLNLSQSAAGPLQQILFGALLIVIMFVRPGGLVADRPRARRRTTAPERPAPPNEKVTHAS
jgi:branched-chain amino acid transport system permease protein